MSLSTKASIPKPLPAHRRPLPAGRKLARVLRPILRRQLEEVRAFLHAEIGLGIDRFPGRVPTMRRWDKAIAQAAEPVLAQYYREGARSAARRLGRNSHALSAADRHTVRELAAKMARQINTTSNKLLAKAYRARQEAIRRGASEAQATRAVLRRATKIFADPRRAKVIGLTEGVRAFHAGQEAFDEASGAVKAHRWRICKGACPKCVRLNGKVVALGKPFTVDERGEPVYYPPRHPRCRCVTESVRR